MRKSDIFSVIIIATVGTLASYFAVNAFLGDPNMSSAQITTIQDISPTLTAPDPELFNFDAINPTVEVNIEECEDIDGNDIIDIDELRKCEQTKEKEDEQIVYTCSNGAMVLDISICEQIENSVIEYPDTPEESETQLHCPGDYNQVVSSLSECAGTNPEGQ